MTLNSIDKSTQQSHTLESVKKVIELLKENPTNFLSKIHKILDGIASAHFKSDPSSSNDLKNVNIYYPKLCKTHSTTTLKCENCAVNKLLKILYNEPTSKSRSSYLCALASVTKKRTRDFGTILELTAKACEGFTWDENPTIISYCYMIEGDIYADLGYYKTAILLMREVCHYAPPNHSENQFIKTCLQTSNICRIYALKLPPNSKEQNIFLHYSAYYNLLGTNQPFKHLNIREIEINLFEFFIKEFKTEKEDGRFTCEIVKEKFNSLYKSWSSLDGKEVPILVMAVDNKCENITELLLANNVDIDQTDDQGLSALTVAVDDQNETLVKTLLDHGADVNHIRNLKTTPLLLAASKDNQAIIELLLKKKAEVNYSINGLSPLMCACQKHEEKIVRLFIEHGAEVNSRSKKGITPLMFASKGPYVEVVELLLNNGAEVNAECSQKYSPLLYASCHGQTEIIKMLLDHGADIKHEDHTKSTALLLASKHSFKKDVEILLDRGADANELDSLGISSLMYASEIGHIGTAEHLIKNGAKINQANIEGLTPLFYASKANNPEMVQFLIDNGADIDCESTKDLGGNLGEFTPMLAASACGCFSVVLKLLENKVNVNYLNSRKTTALQLASKYGFSDILWALAMAGADVNQANDNGETPLHLAIKSKKMEIVRDLIELGANLNQTDNENKTPSDIAEKTDIDLIKTTINNASNNLNILGVSNYSEFIFSLRRQLNSEAEQHIKDRLCHIQDHRSSLEPLLLKVSIVRDFKGKILEILKKTSQNRFIKYFIIDDYLEVKCDFEAFLAESIPNNFLNKTVQAILGSLAVALFFDQLHNLSLLISENKYELVTSDKNKTFIIDTKSHTEGVLLSYLTSKYGLKFKFLTNVDGFKIRLNEKDFMNRDSFQRILSLVHVEPIHKNDSWIGVKTNINKLSEYTYQNENLFELVYLDQTPSECLFNLKNGKNSVKIKWFENSQNKFPWLTVNKTRRCLVVNLEHLVDHEVDFTLFFEYLLKKLEEQRADNEKKCEQKKLKESNAPKTETVEKFKHPIFLEPVSKPKPQKTKQTEFSKFSKSLNENFHSICSDLHWGIDDEEQICTLIFQKTEYEVVVSTGSVKGKNKEVVMTVPQSDIYRYITEKQLEIVSNSDNTEEIKFDFNQLTQQKRNKLQNRVFCFKNMQSFFEECAKKRSHEKIEDIEKKPKILKQKPTQTESPTADSSNSVTSTTQVQKKSSTENQVKQSIDYFNKSLETALEIKKHLTSTYDDYYEFCENKKAGVNLDPSLTYQYEAKLKYLIFILSGVFLQELSNAWRIAKQELKNSDLIGKIEGIVTNPDMIYQWRLCILKGVDPFTTDNLINVVAAICHKNPDHASGSVQSKDQITLPNIEKITIHSISDNDLKSQIKKELIRLKELATPKNNQNPSTIKKLLEHPQDAYEIWARMILISTCFKVLATRGKSRKSRENPINAFKQCLTGMTQVRNSLCHRPAMLFREKVKEASTFNLADELSRQGHLDYFQSKYEYSPDPSLINKTMDILKNIFDIENKFESYLNVEG